MASNSEDISNNLDEIRKELRIANQLTFFELTYTSGSDINTGRALLDELTPEEARVYADLIAKLSIKERA